MAEQSNAASVAPQSIILVVDNVEESREGIERLLVSDGYRVQTARSENAAIALATCRSPQLILTNLGGSPHEEVATARRMRENGVAGIVPIVVFCVEWSADGENVYLGDNIYVAHPDNFNQLREFLRVLLMPDGRAG